MRALMLCLITFVVAAADLDYRLVVHKDGTERRGWWDPDTSILHEADDRRTWYSDRSIVVRTQRLAPPEGAERPTVRVFKPEPVRYVRLRYTENGGGILGVGWLVTDGFDRFALHTDAPIPISGRDLSARHAVEILSSGTKRMPDGLDREAYGMAVQSGLNPTP